MGSCPECKKELPEFPRNVVEWKGEIYHNTCFDVKEKRESYKPRQIEDYLEESECL